MKQLLLVTTLIVCLSAAGSAVMLRQPDVRIADLAAIEAAVAAHRGQAILVNFWAIWCEPCVAELPELAEVSREFKNRGGIVLTVSYDLMIPDATAAGVLGQVKAFLAERKLDLPVLIYDGPDYDAINQRFGLPGPVPMTIAIDRTGAVVARHPGKAGKERFAELMQQALREPDGQR